jgi:Fe-S cluster assembly protein SufD
MTGAKETQNRYLIEFQREFQGFGEAGAEAPASNVAGQGVARHGVAGQGVAGQGVAGQGLTGQGLTGQGMARQGMAGQRGPTWLQEIRETAIRRFAELDFPTTKQEDWKYTNVSPIAGTAFELAGRGGSRIDIDAARQLLAASEEGLRLVFVDGQFNKALSSEKPPNGVRIGSIAELFRSAESVIEGQLGRTADFSNNAFTALNTAFVVDGAFVEISSGTVVESPLYLVYIATGGGAQQSVCHPRNMIIAGDNSQATVVERYVSLEPGRYFTNAVTEIIARDGAVVDHVKLQQEAPAAFHVASLHVRQSRDSSFKSYSITLGGTLVRNDINVVLDGEGAECELDGLYIENEAQHVDNHTLIDHARPHGSSRETYKGILDGKSTGVFNGSIVVRKDAQKTDARQSNKNLLLSRDAEINTKPQLEILADDVKCSHGATIGHIDQEAIFYMRSRGIDQSAARSLMMYAFCNEILERIKHAETRDLVSKAVFGRITGGRGISEDL